MLKRLTRGSAADAGFGLIEVIVAIVVLAVISTGIVASMSTIMRMTADNRARITAANLAAQDLDLVRAIADPYQVSNKVTYSSPDNTTYHPDPSATVYTVTRTVSWVSATGSDVSCNSSTNLLYLRVNVRVTWSGMLSTTKPVQDDTVIAPSDASSNAETGAVALSVEDSAGQPVSGVQVTITPTTGGTGQPLQTQPKPTTVDGCTYANQIAPGDYDVSFTKAGYIDPSQQTTSKTTVTVAAGATTSKGISFEKAATYSITYAPGPAAPYSGPTPQLASNLPVNLISGGTSYTLPAPSSTRSLYPYPSGYSATTGFAGSSPVTCASIDPASWNQGTSNGVALADGVRSSANPAAGPGGAASIRIVTGVVLVRAASGAVLHATEAPAVGAGNPGCGVTGQVLNWATTGNGGWVALAMPYGSWTITANGATVAATDLQVPTNVAPGGVSADGTVTLDPRKAR